MTEAPLAVTGEWQAINLINFPRGWKKEEAKVLLTYEFNSTKKSSSKKKKKETYQTQIGIAQKSHATYIS